jgi:hypothetical protein
VRVPLRSRLWWWAHSRGMKKFLEPPVGGIDLYISEGEHGNRHDGLDDRPDLMKAGDPFVVRIEFDNEVGGGAPAKHDAQKCVQSEESNLRVYRWHQWSIRNGAE